MLLFKPWSLRTLGVYLLLSSSTAAFCQTSIKKVSFDIPLKGVGHIPTDLYIPTDIAVPKGLVIVTPGTSGMGDYYLEGSWRAKVPDYNQQGGIVQLLAAAGYASAFFWHSGIMRSKDCIEGETFETRKKSLLTNCYIKNIRQKADLNSATLATETAHKFLSENHLTNKLIKIALANSEGSYHVAKLIEARRIEVDGIVLIGGMLESLSSTFQYQFRKDYFFNKMERTFEITQKNQLTFAEFVKYGNFNIDLEYPKEPTWGIGQAIGGVVLEKQDFSKRKKYFYDLNSEALRLFIKKNVAPAVPAKEFTNISPEYDAFNYFAQALNANRRVINYLEAYKGKVHYLFGEYDAQVQIPENLSCNTLILSCKIEVIKGVGHGLENEQGYFPEHSKRAVLNAVNSVFNKN